VAPSVDAPSRVPVVPLLIDNRPADDQSAHTRRRRLGIAAIVVSATAMGTAGLFGRMATPPGAVLGEALTFGRMLVGGLGMLVMLALSRRLGKLRRARLSWSVVLGGVFLALSLATYLSATVLTDLSRAVVLHYLGPVLATVFARMFLGETITRRDAVSLVAAFTGMLLAAGLIGGAPAPSSDEQVLGTVLGVVSGVFYGAALLCYRYRSDMPADVRSFWTFAFGAAATGLVVVVTRPDLSGMTPGNWVWAIGFFVVCGLFALGLLVVAGSYLRAAELAGLSYLEVVVALLLGVAVFGESVSLLAGVGAGLVIVAMALPLTSPRRR